MAYKLANWIKVESGRGLSPVLRQPITPINAESLSFGTIETYFSDICIIYHKWIPQKKAIKTSLAK